ncbi:endonuclease V-domain-containing protein [Piptocephalis cylindrospora]|uniref:Endonuclease V-domain-containing protein n=1 Tax=Piptocephalis cylindrospora TaxID=1907219 RepID=A0A4P9Y446_9FUNG|nr:endonuclease V-domain-containing protein [Piptocephalis cylindrospora]|eukprot:RKP13675.1 endonuclease V-domain-containing protein [Piptocephalis cylindrospora]
MTTDVNMTKDTLDLDDLRAQWDEQQVKLAGQRVTDTQIPQWTRSETDPWKGLVRVGGVDVSFLKEDPSIAVAALVVLAFPSLKILHQEYLQIRMEVPYMAGYLAFREVRPLETILDRLSQSKPECMPQVILVDGNGTLHPRRFGLACHLGVMMDLPTIGVAKNFLNLDDGPLLTLAEVKRRAKENLDIKGDSFDLTGESGYTYGVGLLTSSGASNPLFISPGHRISLEDAISVVLACSIHRIPEPVRAADLLSRQYIREHLSRPE